MGPLVLAAGLVALGAATARIARGAEPDAFQKHMGAGVEALRKGAPADAEPEFRAALAEAEQTKQRARQTAALSLLAHSLEAQRKYGDAEAALGRALEAAEADLGANHPDVVTLLGRMGALYRLEKKYDDAAATFERARLTVTRLYGPASTRVAYFLYEQALTRHQQKQNNMADLLARRAMKIYEDSGRSRGQPEMGMVLSLLGTIADDLGRLDEAETFHAQALQVAEAVFGPESFNTAASLNNLANAYRKTAQYAKANPLYERALGILEKVAGADSPRLMLALGNLAANRIGEGRFDEADALLKRLLAIWNKSGAADADDPTEVLGECIKAYRYVKKDAPADALQAEVERIRRQAASRPAAAPPAPAPPPEPAPKAPPEPAPKGPPEPAPRPPAGPPPSP
jgi:hypothetical protein